VTRRFLALALAAAALSVPGVMSSGADFTAASATPGNTVATAADFNTVAVTMANPGSPLFGTVTLTSTSSSERGIASIAYQAQLGAGAWTTVCTGATAPFSCSWDTTSAANGTYSLRAVATDTSGRSRTSATIASRVVDNQGPTVSLTDPGTFIKGTKTLTATASDAGTGLTNVSISYRRAGASSWITVCSGATSPRSCAWDSTVTADGDIELRASATDGATNVRSTTVITRRVDNTAPVVSNTDPGTMRGLATITSTVNDGAGTGVVSVTGQARAAGTTTWTDICTDASAPYSCTLDSSSYPDGMYEVRSSALDGAGLIGYSAVVTRRVDNTAPAVPTLADPGTMSGTKTLTGTASDTGSGVAAWKVQYRVSPSGTWTDACTDTVTPWASCAWDTTTVADTLYDLRAIATDVAGNTATSATLSAKRVDNVGPTVALASPGTYLRGTVSLSATATDPVGVTSVVFERKASTGSTWTTICSDTATPFTCSWNTTTLADGLYDVRAKATDTLGHISYSTVTARQVDNTIPAPIDVQAGNGGSIAGRPEAGDWVSFTWSEQVNPASVMAGWTGTATAISVKFVDGNRRDTLEVDNAAGTTELAIAASSADLQLNADVVGATVVFDATMVQTGATIKITLGAKRGTTAVKTGAAAAMTWSVSAATTDLAGNACLATAQVTETGATDLDF
jgi:hypothetical protein